MTEYITDLENKRAVDVRTGIILPCVGKTEDNTRRILPFEYQNIEVEPEQIQVKCNSYAVYINHPKCPPFVLDLFSLDWSRRDKIIEIEDEPATRAETLPEAAKEVESEDAPATPQVDHPSHYNQGEIQPYDFIKSQKMDFTEGSIIKYVTRYKFKGKPLEDLKKARWYLDKLIEKEGKNENKKD